MPNQYTPRIECICHNCGKPFTVPPNRITAGRGKFCSSSCYWQAKKVTPDVACVCGVCGEPFTVPLTQVERGGGKFCSRICADIAKIGSGRPVAERFWEQVDTSGDCWLWTGRLNDSGYGVLSVDAHLQRAHRIAFELAYGPIPEGMFVLHTCDNPSCVRNDDEGSYQVGDVLCPRRGHLFLGTNEDNIRDMVAKGRDGAHVHPERWRRGTEHHSAKLTEDAVREIRRLGAIGVHHRDIAARYGISHAAVGHIVRGKTWRHVE